MAKIDKKTCYIISPIGKPDSEIRSRSDKILNYIIKPVVTELGYEEPLRSDMDQEDMITPGIIKHLLNDTLVIADLTNANPNVYYELGIRHLRELPVVHLIQKGQKSVFDTQDQRAIPISMDYEVVVEAKRRMKKRILALKKNPTLFNSPVRLAITLLQQEEIKKKLTGTERDEQGTLTEILNLVIQNRQDLQDLKQNAGQYQLEKNLQLKPEDSPIREALKQYMENLIFHSKAEDSPIIKALKQHMDNPNLPSTE